jgi:hypothetical protein
MSQQFEACACVRARVCAKSNVLKSFAKSTVMQSLAEWVLCECVYRCATTSPKARLLSIDIHATFVKFYQQL